MAEPLRLLTLGKDPTLFEQGESVPGDARQRHIRYAQAMRESLGADSEMRIVTYTRRSSGNRYDEPAPGLKLYGTSSLHRATFLPDCMRLVGQILRSGWRPTAITTQTPWEEGGFGALLARRLGARFLPQLHFDLFSPEWRSENLLNRWRGLVAEQVLRSATRVRVVSEPLRQKVSERLGIDRSRIDIIPVGVNFTPSTLGVEEAKSALDPRLAGRPVVLFVGRLTYQKNLHLWLDVAADVLTEMPDARFAIVGSGELEAELRAIIAQRNQTDSILLLGPRGHEQLPDVYRAADVFMLSSHYEGFGRVILEAGFAEVPAVATRCTGPEDIIEPGVSGILTPKSDRKALAEGTLELLRDPRLRKRMGRAAQASAQARFGLDALAARLVEHWSRP